MSPQTPEITVMPLNYNGRALLEDSLPSIEREAQNAPVSTQVWLIDNASHDDSREYVESKHPSISFKAYPVNRILTTYNQAIEECPSPYVLILNNDVVLGENFIEPLWKRIKQDPDYFAISPAITSDVPSENYQRRRLGKFYHGHLAGVEASEGCGGALYFHGGAALIRKDKFLELGGFDELFFYFEDNDLSYRAWRRGWPCVFEPGASMHHLGGKSVEKLEAGADHRRALKEKASQLFILKQIQDPGWILNFMFWTLLKCIKMILTFDSARAWAMKETLIHLPKIIKRRHQQVRLKDKSIMKKIETLVLDPL